MGGQGPAALFPWLARQVAWARKMMLIISAINQALLCADMISEDLGHLTKSSQAPLKNLIWLSYMRQ